MARIENSTPPPCAKLADGKLSAKINTAIAVAFRVMVNISFPPPSPGTADRDLDEAFRFAVGWFIKVCDFLRLSAKKFLVQGAVIFPRVHVPRNKGRIDGQPEHVCSVFVEEAAQTGVRIKALQFVAIAEVD